MKRGDHGNPGSPRGAGRHNAKRGIQTAVDVHDVEALGAEQCFQLAGETPPDGYSRDAAIRVDDETLTNPPHIGRIDVTVHTHARGHDRRPMAQTLQLAGEVVHMLRHAAELRIVVLRDQGDAQHRHLARCARRSRADTTAAGRSSCR